MLKLMHRLRECCYTEYHGHLKSCCNTVYGEELAISHVEVSYNRKSHIGTIQIYTALTTLLIRLHRDKLYNIAIRISDMVLLFISIFILFCNGASGDRIYGKQLEARLCK